MEAIFLFLTVATPLENELQTGRIGNLGSNLAMKSVLNCRFKLFLASKTGKNSGQNSEILILKTLPAFLSV